MNLSYKFVCICKNYQYDFELDSKRSQITKSFRRLVASALSIREMSRFTLLVSHLRTLIVRYSSSVAAVITRLSFITYCPSVFLYLYLSLFIQDLSCATGSREILYRVQLPYMEELTLVYLEKEADEPNDELSKL